LWNVRSEESHKTLQIAAVEDEAIAIDLRKGIRPSLENIALIAIDRPVRADKNDANNVFRMRSQGHFSGVVVLLLKHRVAKTSSDAFSHADKKLTLRGTTYGNEVADAHASDQRRILHF